MSSDRADTIWAQMSEIRSRYEAEEAFSKIAQLDSHMRELWSEFVMLGSAPAQKLPTMDEYFEMIARKNDMLDGYDTWSAPLFACPVCDGEVRRLESEVYMSMPPRHKYRCDACEWEMYGE